MCTPKLLHIKTDIIPPLKFLPIMITRAISARTPIDHIIGKIRLNQTIVTEKTIVKKSKQNKNTCSQSRAQTTSVISNSNTNNTEITESMLPSGVIESLPPASFILIQRIHRPRQVPR